MARTTTRLHAEHRPNDGLLRAVSHDLGASLIVLGDAFRRLKAALGEANTGQLADCVAQVEACLAQSRQLSGDLGRLARTGSIDLAPSRVEVAAVVAQVLLEQQTLLARRGINVSVREPLPTVCCHGDRMKQIITNLVRNAALHGCDASRPRIIISPATPPGSGRNHPMAGFVIHDNGPGIERRLHDEIFLPGRRVAPLGAEGSGMGLAIVRELAEGYGGRAYIEPAFGPGTAFVVVLPAADEPAAEPTDRRGRSLQLDLGHGELPGQFHAFAPPAHCGGSR